MKYLKQKIKQYRLAQQLGLFPKAQVIHKIFGLVLFIMSTVLMIYWYDFKLFLAVFMFVWSNNITSPSK